MAPLLSALGDLAGEIRVEDGAVMEVVSVVGEGARIIATVVEGLNGDLNALEIAGDRDIGTALRDVTGGVSDFALRTARDVGRQRAVLNAVERGLPADPAALVEFGLEVVLPFPTDALQQVRGQVDGALTGLGALALTPTRVEGVVRVLGEVRVAADAGDIDGLRTALAELARVRADTIRHLGDDLRGVGTALDRLGLDRALQVIADAADRLRVPELGVIEDLNEWRQRLEEATAGMGRFDADAARDGARAILDRFETEAEARIGAVFDQQIERLEAWLRGLLRELPIRRIRNDITAQIEEVARAIAGAELDRVAREIRGGLDTLTEALESLDLEEVVNQATAELAGLLSDALDQVEAALGTITDQINALAAEASAILAQVVDGLRSFREAVDAVRALIDDAGIEEATRSVVETLSSLRETASELLSAAPLPDELRPVVEQLTEQVRAIDLESAIGEPLRAAADLLQLPPDAGDTVQEGLDAVAETISNLIPENVAQDLQAELDGLFQQLTAMDLSSLTAGISEQLDAVAAPLEAVDVPALVAPAADAFADLVEVFDRLEPHRLLRPAIDAYDSLLGQLPVPDPATIASRAGQVVSTAGEAATRAAAAPLAAAAGSAGGAAASGGTAAAGTGAAGGGGQARPGTPTDAGVGGVPALPEGLRPGDIIRLVGFIPARLHEALRSLEAGGAGQVLTGLQRLCGGLAADLRRLQAELMGIDERLESELDALLRPVAEAQVDAHLSLSAHATVLAEAGIDVEASGELVAGVSGEALKRELDDALGLLSERAGGAVAGLGGGAAHRIDRVAGALESCALASIGEDLDAFLDALDPEPIAAAFDALIARAFDLAADALPTLQALVPEFEARVRRLVDRYNPGAQAQRLLVVLEVLREELDLLNPRRLADELAEVHAAVRAALTAYDPAVFARELDELVTAAAAAVRGLDPAGLVPDLAPIRAQIDRVPGLLPLDALEGVGEELDAVGEALNDLDVPGMIETVNAIAPTVADAIDDTIEAVKAEIVALLESIRYASSHAGASGSVSVGGSIGL